MFLIPTLGKQRQVDLLSLKLAWFTDLGQPELHREILCKKRGKKEFIEDRIKFTNSGSGVRHKLLLKLFL